MTTTFTTTIATLLTCAGYTVHAFASSPKALSHIDRQPPDLVVTDRFMSIRDGFEALRHVKKGSAVAAGGDDRRSHSGAGYL